MRDKDKVGNLVDFVKEIREFLRENPQGDETDWEWEKADANKFAVLSRLAQEYEEDKRLFREI